MNKLKAISFIAVFIFSVLSAGSVYSETSYAQKLRIERVNAFLDSFSLDKKFAEEVVPLIVEASRSFSEIVNARITFEMNMNSPKVKAKASLLSQYNEHNTDLLKDYSESISNLISFLDKNLNQDQIQAIHGFLYDELWYEGFVNEESAKTKKAIDYFAQPVFDSTSILNQYNYEELEAIEEGYLEGENEALFKDHEPPEITAKVRKTVASVSRPPVSIENVSPPPPGLPPWHDLPSSPSTAHSSRNLLEDRSIPELQYYWMQLYPLADSLLGEEAK